MIWNLKVKYIKSFLPNETNLAYNLINIGDEYPKIVELFKEDIKKLENPISDCILCFRGDSKENLELHKDFFDKGLSKDFMIGSKSKSNYYKNNDDPFEFYEGKPQKYLLEDIDKLIEICNSEILSKPKNHLVGGNIGEQFMQYLNELEREKLEHWRLFFISFLHNNGEGRKFKKFKDYSPFTSLTYGEHKGRIARKFAIKKTGNGIIYIVSVSKREKSYIKTNEMINTMKNHGVNWYEDIHSELMLLNGIFPHDILGVMEVKKKRTPLLVINPWLFKEYLNGNRFDLNEGIPVNQKNFKKFVQEETDYKRYSWKNYSGDQFLEEIDQERGLIKLSKFE